MSLVKRLVCGKRGPFVMERGNRRQSMRSYSLLAGNNRLNNSRGYYNLI